MRCSKSSPKREVNSNTILPQEIRKTSNRQSNFTPKTTGKRRMKIKLTNMLRGKERRKRKNRYAKLNRGR